jgi:hypothetical protein
MTYIKPTATYKMSKPLKTSLALSRFSSDEQRANWKRAMIQAELFAQLKVREKKKSEPDLGE